MSSSSGPSHRSIRGANNVDFETRRSRMTFLFSCRPVSYEPPIVDLPLENTVEEATLLRLTCLHVSAHDMEFRRAIITEDNHLMTPVLAFSVLRCPEDLKYAIYVEAVLVGRMLKYFVVWRIALGIDDPAMAGTPIARLKQLAEENLPYLDTLSSIWMEMFLRVFGDLPEVWNKKLSEIRAIPAQGTAPSMPGVPGSFNVERRGGASVGPSQPFQSVFNPVPPTYGASFGPFDSLPVPMDSASSTTMMYDQPGPSQSLPYPALFDPLQDFYGGEVGSSHSLPLTFLSDPALGMRPDNNTSSHSLPNPPFGAISEGMHTGGLNGDWTSYNPVSLGHRGQLSGSGSTQNENSRRGPQPSNLTRSVQPTLANAYESVPTMNATSTAMNTSNSFLDNAMASYTPMSSGSAPAPTIAGTARKSVRQGPGGTSRRAKGQASIKDTIAYERARASTLTCRNNNFRCQSDRLAQFLQLLTENIRFFFDSLHRLLCSDYLEIPIPMEHRVALLGGAQAIGRVMAYLFTEWKEDIEARPRL
ncbi:hypothetical protein GSI_04116 [Ganoderma sinense ZZ0214-1]|uniref:Uncharacterized protein n=1 Tax=Ganoderma sinense ZZ0214-1 TaxID=1077348 RepID=A0A2G8SIA4_9APHY|nr:hypothetical protein GSI_04116 [Ganoderma sinense ZZ0214-1]